MYQLQKCLSFWGSAPDSPPGPRPRPHWGTSVPRPPNFENAQSCLQQTGLRRHVNNKVLKKISDCSVDREIRRWAL